MIERFEKRICRMIDCNCREMYNRLIGYQKNGENK